MCSVLASSTVVVAEQTALEMINPSRGRWRVIKCPRMLQHMHFNPIVYHKVLAGSLVNPPFAPGGCVPGPGRALSSDWTDD